MAFAPTTPDGEYLFRQSGEIDFNLFLPHNSVDVLFVFGNILIFTFAAIGFFRFWKGLQAGGKGTSLSFGKAVILTIKEIITHHNFYKCEANRPRALSHLLLFWGFVGAMITTGSVFIFIFVPHYLGLLGLDYLKPVFELPTNLPNPIKILGMLSGIALIVGGAMMVIQRWTNRDNVGANGYPDYLFLYVMSLAGLTGMLSWITRLIGIPMLAYVNYFLHLLVVFFLLWYMPYSKFAHMFYRSLALVYCRTIGRNARAS